MKIDFQIKDTDAGWYARLDRMFLALVPEWFNWLGWILILGALQYFQSKSKNIFLAILITLSYFSLWRYIIAVFYKFEIAGTPFLKSLRAHKVFSHVLSGVLAFGFWKLAGFLSKLAANYTS